MKCNKSIIVNANKLYFYVYKIMKYSNVKFFYITSIYYCEGATSIEKYDLRTNMWTPVANMNGRRLQFGVAVLDDKLYVVGGRDGLKTLNTVECYNPKTKTWSVMPPMSTHRHGLGEYNHARSFMISSLSFHSIFTFCTRQKKTNVGAAESAAVSHQAFLHMLFN